MKAAEAVTSKDLFGEAMMQQELPRQVSDAAYDATDVSSRCKRTRQKEGKHPRRLRAKCYRVHYHKPVGVPECLHLGPNPTSSHWLR